MTAADEHDVLIVADDGPPARALSFALREVD